MVVAGLILAGCSASRGCQLCTARISPAGFDLTATEKDHLVTMHVGQKLEVVLRAPAGTNDWSHPESSDSSILTPIVDPAATAARYVTLAGFEARKPGQVEVTSYASPLCSPGQACPMYVALYSLMVTVTQ